MTEPAWMKAVRERDEMFGLRPTTLEETETWASVGVFCANGDAFYSMPAFLEGQEVAYAAQDGWRCVDGRWLCSECARKAA